MDDPTVTLESADARALPYVETLLEENDLPTADVRSTADCFYVAFDGESRVGIGGLEWYGTVGLLRSVVVDRPHRGEGYGMALCDALESTASDRGIATLFLLTTTAAGFFANREYLEVDRDDVPEAIQQTREFAELCPSRASCMRKTLDSA